NRADHAVPQGAALDPAAGLATRAQREPSGARARRTGRPLMLDVVVIGAGPCGLAVGGAAKRAHPTCSLFDKGPVVSSLMRYPLYMTFSSTPDKLEVGGVPLVT